MKVCVHWAWTIHTYTFGRVLAEPLIAYEKKDRFTLSLCLLLQEQNLFEVKSNNLIPEIIALIDVVKCEIVDGEFCRKFPSEDLRIGTQLVV